jgi:GNAT superfamily N-acetyltransferase
MSEFLAPNGKPSNLTPKQYKLVRKPEFKAWFGDWENDTENSSKVVDANGEPMVCYHATDNKFWEFKKEKQIIGYYGKGFYFSNSLEKAKQYGKRVIPAFLNIKSVFELSDETPQELLNELAEANVDVVDMGEENDIEQRSKYTFGYASENSDIFMNNLIKNSYYGIRMIYDLESTTYFFIVFESNQIKLADGTNTTFDSDNPDIRFDDGGVIKTSKDENGNWSGTYSDMKFTLYNLSEGWSFTIDFYSPIMLSEKTFFSDEDYEPFKTKKSAIFYMIEKMEGIKSDNENFIKKRQSKNPDIRFNGGGNVKKVKFIIDNDEEEERIKISIKDIGEVILSVTYPEYEFLEDVGEDGIEEVGVEEGDLIGKIEHLEIDDEYKGQGYAKLLMNKAIEVAKEKGLIPLYLNASPMGSKQYGLNIYDLTGFYESLGFEVFLRQGGNNLMILKNTYKNGGLTKNNMENKIKFSKEEHKDFNFWKQDGNVSKNPDGSYSTQDAQWTNRLKDLDALKQYYYKEFLSDRPRYAGGGSADDKHLIAKAIEFIIGSAIDTNSIEIEPTKISFKRKNTNVYTNLNKKLIEDTIRMHGKSLKGRFAKGGEAGFDDTNTSMVIYHEEKGNFMFPKDLIYLWLYEGENASKKIESEEYDWVLYPFSSISMMGQRGFIPPLKKIWTKKFQKQTKGSEHLLGVIKAHLLNDGKELYIDMMSVNPTKKKKGVMSYMIKDLRDTYNLTQDQVTFSNLTDEGKKFVAKKTYNNGGGVGQFPPKGELTNKDNFLLKYEKKGGEYEFLVYKPITKEVSGYNQIKHVCLNKDCPQKMTYEQFINYLYAELYLDDTQYADGGETEEVYIEFLNKEKGFKKDTKYFNSYEEAVEWAKENFDKFNPDMIKYKYADGGDVPHEDKMFQLPLEMVVYVPSTQDVDKVISVDKMDKRVDEVKEYLASKFGGYTSSDKLGGYVDSTGNLVNEDVVQVTSFSTQEAYDENKEELINQLAKWGKQWGQEAIGFEFEGDLMYVPQELENETKVDEYRRGGFMYEVQKKGSPSNDMRETMFTAKNLTELKKQIIEKYGTSEGFIVSRRTEQGYYAPVKFKNGGAIYPDLSLQKADVVNDSVVLDEFQIKKTKNTFQINGLENLKITKSDDAVKILRELFEKDTISAYKQSIILYLNKNNKVIGYYNHSSGGIDGTVMDVEMISGLALKSLAKGVIVSHNHPSENTKPSDADIRITKQLNNALKLFNIDLVDSIILTENSHLSFQEEGLIY